MFYRVPGILCLRAAASEEGCTDKLLSPTGCQSCLKNKDTATLASGTNCFLNPSLHLRPGCPIDKNFHSSAKINLATQPWCSQREMTSSEAVAASWSRADCDHPSPHNFMLPLASRSLAHFHVAPGSQFLPLGISWVKGSCLSCTP